VASILKDIKAERPHITDKDNLRLLFLVRWFLEYFIVSHKDKKWSYELVSEVIDRGMVVWVLKRMRNALEEKVCIRCRKANDLLRNATAQTL
jgi:replication fork protection complex subunit Tof1/Swi1